MSGLPKKYAKMGFAKGWKAYKQIHGKKRARPGNKIKGANHMSKKGTKLNGMNLIKAGAYTAAVALPVYTSYKQLIALGQDRNTALANAGKTLVGIDWHTDELSYAVAAQAYGPVCAVLLVDWATSRLGLQRRIARVANSIIG